MLWKDFTLIQVLINNPHFTCCLKLPRPIEYVGELVSTNIPMVNKSQNIESSSCPRVLLDVYLDVSLFARREKDVGVFFYLACFIAYLRKLVGVEPPSRGKTTYLENYKLYLEI